VVLARDEDEAARSAVRAVDRERGDWSRPCASSDTASSSMPLPGNPT